MLLPVVSEAAAAGGDSGGGGGDKARGEGNSQVQAFLVSWHHIPGSCLRGSMASVSPHGQVHSCWESRRRAVKVGGLWCMAEGGGAEGRSQFVLHGDSVLQVPGRGGWRNSHS